MEVQLSRANPPGTLTILVVEDDVANAELLRTLLNRVPGWGATVPSLNGVRPVTQ